MGFIPQDAGTTLVEFEQRDLERHGAEDDQRLYTAFNHPGGWGGILRGYAELAAA